VGRKAVSSWNKVVRLLINLEKTWEKHREMMLVLPDLEEVDIKGQEFLTLTLNRTPFRLVMPELIRLMLSRGSLEELMIPLQKEPKVKETVVNKAITA